MVREKKSGKLKKKSRSGNFILEQMKKVREFSKEVDSKQAPGNYILHKLLAFILRNSFSHIHGLRFF